MTMSKSILHILSFIIFTAFLSSCVTFHQTSMTNNVVRHADTFRNKIDKYEASRSKAYNYINEIAQQTIKDLNSKTPDFGSISKNWEREWKYVHSHYGQLCKNFTTVVEVSNEYFKIIDNVGNDIVDPIIKQAELRKNKQLKNNWITVSTAADKNIKSLRQVIQTGDDFHKTMLGATLRARPDGSMENIKIISEKARRLLKNLINLTTVGQNLIPARSPQEEKIKEDVTAEKVKSIGVGTVIDAPVKQLEEADSDAK